MRRKNIDCIIAMTKDFIDGNIDCLTYSLNYNYELMQRWDKMTRESSELADMVNFYLFEMGFDTVNCESGHIVKVCDFSVKNHLVFLKNYRDIDRI